MPAGLTQAELLGSVTIIRFFATIPVVLETVIEVPPGVEHPDVQVMNVPGLETPPPPATIGAVPDVPVALMTELFAPDPLRVTFEGTVTWLATMNVPGPNKT